MNQIRVTSAWRAPARRCAAVASATLAAFLLLLAAGTLTQAAMSFELRVSTAPDRSSPAPLAGRSVSGPVYVFVAPESGASEVKFYRDDPLRQKAPFRTERTPPWDFAGGTTTLASPFDTTTLVDGSHTITAAISLSTGGTEVITSGFTVANGAPRLVAEPSALTFTVQQGGTAGAQTVNVSMSDGSSAFISISDDAPWLSATPAVGSTQQALSVAVDATGLAVGTYTGAVTVSGTGLEALTVPVTLRVESGQQTGGYRLLTSPNADRSGAVALDDQTVQGNVHVFVLPEAGASRVRFYLDDPNRTGSPRKSEGRAPWDFAGTAANGTAIPFDTTTIADGLHSITAAVDLTAGGTEVVTSNFRVANMGPSLAAAPASLMFGVEPGGSAASQNVALSMSDGSAAAFSVTDDAPWLSVSPVSGTTPRQLSVAVNAAGLAAGTYGATVTIASPGVSSLALPVTLQVQDSRAPDQVHLSWTKEPSTTLTVVWRTLQTSTPHVVEYRPAGTSAWLTATGSARVSGTTGTLHEVTLENLSPSTTYEYRVRGDGSSWSDVFSARTAPPRGPADFDAIYVADTGIAGRTDGLTTGTLQVVDEIARLDPDLVLLGGDYAYFNTETRFATLDDAIDAWFNQMQEVGARSPMMVSYGNHETLLSERFEDWAPRFATPEGWSSRRAYSFDVGDVHFVSIFAVSDTGGLTSGQLTWIEQDIAAASAAGARWVVPFFHVSPFSDGKNHPSNLQLRAQLGPLFERLGVKIAIASHDQAYERSYPLVGVPSSTRATTTAKRCYTSSDGVTWVKVSPGGKLSNKNEGFSQFATSPPPSWTAFRHNTAHHFARLRVSAGGTLGLDTYAVTGDGSPPVIIDSFEYRLGSCPPELTLDKTQLEFNVAADGTASQSLSVARAGGGAAAFTVSDNASWLSVTPQSGTTPATLQVTAAAAGLAAGQHTGTITVSATGATPATAAAALNVHGIVMSTSPDRSAPVPLDSRTVAGRIYVYTLPHAGPTQVRFWLDDPAMAGTPRKVENGAPWDFAGTASDGSALPFDTSKLTPGQHTITAAIDVPGGATIVTDATFNR
jgi:hypothetical protein